MSRIDSPDTQLIDLLRRADAPSDADVQRVRAAVALNVAMGVGTTAAILVASHSSWAMRLGSIAGWVKGAFFVSSLVGVGVGITLYAKPETLLIGESRVAQQQVPTTEAARAVRVLPSGPRDASATESNAPPQADEPDAKLRSAAPRPSSRPAASTLEAELQLLGRAQRALTTGRAVDALKALDEHAKRYPSGVLALERSGVRTIALCQAGRVAEGRNAARSFMRSVPNSVLAKRIRVACRLSDE